MSVTNELKSRLLHIEGLDSNVHSITLQKKNKKKNIITVPKRSKPRNLFSWFIHIISCTLIPRNRGLDAATRAILKDLNNLKLVTSDENILITKVISQLRIFNRKNGGKNGLAIEKTAFKINSLLKNVDSTHDSSDDAVKSENPPLEPDPQNDLDTYEETSNENSEKKEYLIDEVQDQPAQEISATIVQQESLENKKNDATQPVEEPKELKSLPEKDNPNNIIGSPKIHRKTPAIHRLSRKFEDPKLIEDPNLIRINKVELEERQNEQAKTPVVTKVKPATLPAELKELIDHPKNNYSFTLETSLRYANVLLNFHDKDKREKGLELLIPKIQKTPPAKLSIALDNNKETITKLFPRFNSKTQSRILARAFWESIKLKNSNYDDLFKTALRAPLKTWEKASKRFTVSKEITDGIFIENKDEKKFLNFKDLKSITLSSRGPNNELKKVRLIDLSPKISAALSKSQFELGNNQLGPAMFSHYFSDGVSLEKKREFLENIDIKFFRDFLPPHEIQDDRISAIYSNFINALDACANDGHARTMTIDTINQMLRNENLSVEEIKELTPKILLLPLKGDCNERILVGVKSKKVSKYDDNDLLKEFLNNPRFQQKDGQDRIVDWLKAPTSQHTKYDEIYTHLLAFICSHNEALLPDELKKQFNELKPFEIKTYTTQKIHTISCSEFIKLLPLNEKEDQNLLMSFKWKKLIPWLLSSKDNYLHFVNLLPLINNPTKFRELIMPIIAQRKEDYFMTLFTALEKESWKAGHIKGYNDYIYKWLNKEENRARFPACRFYFDHENAKEVLERPETIKMTSFFKYSGRSNIDIRAKVGSFHSFNEKTRHAILGKYRLMAPKDLKEELFDMHPPVLALAIYEDETRANVLSALTEGDPVPKSFIEEIESYVNQITRNRVNYKGEIEVVDQALKAKMHDFLIALKAKYDFVEVEE